jgi:peptidoglycan hydrolase-like protein with peptidoglycan-binding domain
LSVAESIRGSTSGGGSTTPPAAGSRPAIRNGSRGDAVREAQQLLNRQISAGLTTDGIFGNLTDAAVRRFQTERGLGVDGIVGPITWGRLLG